MTLKSGMNASLGFVTEGTWGIYQAPTRWVPLVKHGIKKDIARLESKGIIAGRRVIDADQWSPGNVDVEGPVELELYDRSIGLLFTHMFGAVVTTGTGPFTHTFTPGTLTGKGLTIQAGMPNTTDGTVHPYSSIGCKVAEWELGCAAGEVATLGLDILAKNQVTTETLVSPSYATGIGIGMTFVGATVTLAGSAYKTMEATLAGSNGLSQRRFYSADGTIDEPLEAEIREHTGTINSELFDLTAYNRFVNGTTAALVYHFARGASTCDITMNVRFDGETPEVDGPGVIGLDLPFKCLADTDAAAITAVLVNADTTP